MDLQGCYYVMPFWVVVFVILRLVVGNYAAVLIATMVFGAVEIFKGRKSDSTTWKMFYEDVNKIGHRGCALNAPENTLASVREAHRLGVKGIEFDIILTADDEPVIFHDSTCDRTSNGTGPIGLMTWKEVQKLDASCKYEGPGNHGKQGVPHLREMLRECKKYGMKVYLDMKGSRPILMSKLLKEMTKEFPDLHEWAVVCSFYPQILIAVKWYLPQFPTILTFRDWVLTTATTNGELRNKEIWKQITAPVADVILKSAIYNFLWYVCGANGVFVNEELVSISELRYWNKRGLDVFVWTVNKDNTKVYLSSLNIPYITDDCRS